MTTLVDWLAMHRRQVTGVCWVCAAVQVKTSWVGYGVPFFCSACSVGWVIQAPKE